MKNPLSDSKVVVFFITALIILFPFLTEATNNQFLLSLGTKIIIYAIAVVGLDLLIGFGGLVSFGHAAFFGVGAYTVGILAHHYSQQTIIPFLPFDWYGTHQAIVQWPIAILISATVAYFIGLLSLRTSGVYFIMITLAFAQMLYHFMMSLPTYNGGDGLNIWDRSDLGFIDLYNETSFFYVSSFFFLIVTILVKTLSNSRFGMTLSAGRQDEVRLTSLGIPIFRYRLIAFSIAGGISGLSGALAANHLEFVGPGLMHWTRSGEFIVMVVLGGMGSIFGALPGTLILLGLEELFIGYTDHWGLILGPVLICLVLFAKKGMWGTLTSLMSNWDDFRK